MTVNKLFVAGAGLMGGGIAQVAAAAGIDVALYDEKPGAVEKALKAIAWSLGKFIEKGDVKEPLETVMRRIRSTDSLADAAGADLAIEAVFENLDVKQKVFAALDRAAGPETLFASNTSAIPITGLAAATGRPDRFVGLHFFSPVPMMKAVEVIRGLATSDESFEKAKEFALQVGKEPILVMRDVAGFVINRINFPSAIEAMRLVEEGVTTVEDVDKGLRLASGRRMGIFETGDMVGLDVTYGAMLAMYHETGDPRFYPPLLLRRKVTAGHLGKKTGRGWYVYDEKGDKIGPARN
jgi:3-hydroxybutyryl-CoA dehydrogenase